MSEPVIKVENLSKKYLLRHQKAGAYTALRDVITQGVKSWGARILSPLSSAPAATTEEFFALKNVSFEIKEGDRVGIIGRNGAGKSTLLKILSRITEPTKGRIEITGRVASLLEVGTGFHPELTGRENIYLNGAILGMSRLEIKRKFDEIVAFAEVERFLDTPVKRYSSGMYVRLAFSVAAHLEPEILIVDEVLAVGDMQFQRKCLGKMETVSKEGRTIIFVSHNMAAINQLCNRAILLEQGQISRIGDVSEVVAQYLRGNNSDAAYRDLTGVKSRRGDRAVFFLSVEVCSSDDKPCRRFSIGDEILFRFKARISAALQGKSVRFVVAIKRSDGTRISYMADIDSRFGVADARDIEDIRVTLKDVRLYPDTYYVTLNSTSLTNTDVYDMVEDCLSFEIVDGGKLTMRRLPATAGVLFLTPEWKRLDVQSGAMEPSQSHIESDVL